MNLDPQAFMPDNTQATSTVPKGFMKDAQGNLIAISNIKPIDLERDDLVRSIAAQAKTVSGSLGLFKYNAMGDVAAFVSMSATQYNATIGGEKGNVTLTSFDGQYKVQRAIQETIAFGEQMQAAKALIDAFLLRETEGSSDTVRTLISHAFQADKEGKINTNSVLRLRSIAIKDEQWQQAMQAIADAMKVVSSKAYIRVYERTAAGKYVAIALDVAGAA